MRSVSFAVAAFLVFRTAFAAVTAHYTFNDAGSGGINLLKASVGQNAIVKTGKNPVVDVAGTGELYATNGPRRADGTGAVAIPKGQFLAIPHGLARSSGQTWFMRMRVFMPREEMHAVFSFEQDNNSDAFLFQKNKASAGGSRGWNKYSEKTGSPFVGNWTTLVFQSNGSGADLYADGVKMLSTHEDSPYSGGSNLTDIEYIYIGADNSGEDNLMFVDDIIIGDGLFYDQIVDIPDPGCAIRNGKLRTSALESSGDYTVKSNEGGIEYGFYPVTVALANPSRKVWEDGTVADKTLWFAVRDVFAPDVAVHFSFDDDGNGGLNLLKAAVGNDAWVRRGNPAVDIAGIGAIAAVNGDGHSDGKGAVAIPTGEFLVMAHGVGANQCWRMDMKCLVPSDSATHRAYFTQYTNNTEDAAIFNFSGLKVGGGANWPGYTETEVTKRKEWHTLSLRSDGRQTSAWINDSWVLDAKPGRLGSLSDSGYIGVSGDNKDEDGLLLVDDVKTYVLKDVVKVPIPLDAGSLLATGETFEAPIANTSRYAVRGVRPSASEPGEYPVTVGLLDPEHMVWSDGTSDDKTVMFIISSAANSWTKEPAVGALVWVAGMPSPAYSCGASEFGAVSAYLNGFPFEGDLPTAEGTYELTFAVPASVDRSALSKSFTLTVLPAGTALSRHISTDAYVTNGLFMFLDGIANAPGGRHDGTSAKWIDASGNGYDWKVDLNYSEWRNDGLYFKGEGMVAIPTDKESDDFKNRINTIEFIWNNDRNDHGIIFGPGFKSSSYLYTDTDGSVGFFSITSYESSIGVPAVLGEDKAYSVDYKRDESAATPTGVNSVFTNGVKVAQLINMKNYWNTGMNEYPLMGNLASGSNRRAKGTLKTLRLYSRSLADEERLLNTALDTLRYGTGKLPAEIGIDGYRVEGDALLVRVNIASAGGKLSVNGGEYGFAETLWVPVGSCITVTGKFNRVKPDRKDAYIREGLPPNAVVSADGAKTTFVANAPANVRIGHPDITDGFFLIVR